MTLSATPYPNNSRQVSGDVALYKDDSILLCDTSVAPVTINLNLIPFGHWNTTWKLYVKDYTNTAAVNNITIVAGTGQKINGQNSIVLNVNGESCIIRITSNYDFIATLSSTSANAGGGYVTIEDEGIALPQRTIIDFVGSNVTATDDPINGRTIVTITGGLESLTNAQMLVLISAGTVVPGQFYLITDGGNGAITATSDLGVIVQGVTSKSITGYGGGLYYNADYQAVGNYASVPSYTANVGIWSTSTWTNAAFTGAGNVVIYGNRNYLNIGGSWGTTPNTDTTNWGVLTKGATKGYLLVCDFVRYDVIANIVTYRADSLGNEVDYYSSGSGISTAIFQWGRAMCYSNKVLSNSYLNCTNSNAAIRNNTLISAHIDDNTTQEGITASEIVGNNLEQGSYISLNNNLGQVNYNRLIGIETYIDCQTIESGCHILQNDLSDGSSIYVASLKSGASGTSNITKVTLVNGSYISVAVEISNGSNITNCYLDGSSFTNPLVQDQSAFSYCSLTTSIINFNIAGAKMLAGTITTTTFNNGRLYFGVLTGLPIENCRIEWTTISVNSLSTGFSSYVHTIGFSNWPYELECSSAISGSTLTIPAGLEYVGVFLLTGCTGSTINLINGAIQANHSFILKPIYNGFAMESITLAPVVVASAGIGNIVQNLYTSLSTNFYQARASIGDYAVLKSVDFCFGLTESNIWV